MSVDGGEADLALGPIGAFLFVPQVDPSAMMRMAMKFAADRPYADPEKAARKILEIASSVEAVQDGRI
jgi:hypothetical protein